MPATSANYTTADLHGNISTNGENLTVFLEYGPTESYGSTIAALPQSVRSLAPASFAKTVTGLVAKTEYH